MLSARQFEAYSAGKAYTALLRELPWTALTPHAQDILRRCTQVPGKVNKEGQPALRGDARAQRSDDEDTYRRWLLGMCCDASPPAVAADSGISCDTAFSGGRLVSYRHDTLLVIGGSAAGIASPLAAAETSGEPPAHAPGSSSSGWSLSGAAAPANTAHPVELPDHSRVHEARELRPLRGLVRLVGAAPFGPGKARTLTTCVTLPPLEGCAVCCYGGCILVHGGVSPTGEVNNDMRALSLAPDPNRPGQYVLTGRALVQQGDTHAAGGQGGPAGGAPGQQGSWWLPVTVIAAAAAGAPQDADGSAGSTADVGGDRQAERTSGGGPAGQSQAGCCSAPCAPPSVRCRHHLVVEADTSRLWMLGGCTPRPCSGAPSGWEPRPSDPQPCCYWAQLPQGGGNSRQGGPGADQSGGSCSSGAGDGPGNHGGTVGGSGSGGGGGGCSGNGAAGDVLVDRMQWHRLPLRPAPASAGGRSGVNRSGAGPSIGPRWGSDWSSDDEDNFPDPRRIAAVTLYDGSLYVLSSGSAHGVGGGSRGSGRGNGLGPDARATIPAGQPAKRWRLHQIDLNTGHCCELAPSGCHPTAMQPTAAPSGKGVVTGAAPGAVPSPSWGPAYHEDAVAMADDLLPCMYVYGSAQLGAGGGGGGGVFLPSVHRLDIRGGGRWEAVEFVVQAGRLHVARGALGVASGGVVTLASGVRDLRRGVEAQLQVVVPAAAAAAGGRGKKPNAPCASTSMPMEEEVSFARCRRVIAERLQAVAPRRVHFAHPNDASGTGGKGRSCVALAAALSLYSQGCLFDDLFEELDDEAESPGRSKRPAPDESTSSSSTGGCIRGMTLPGHDPLSVAAAVAWVMGRTAVRPDWEVRFLAQLFRVANCLELLPLQREVVRVLERRAPVLPPEELPAALGLWQELRRLGVVAAEERAGRVESALRLQLQRAATSYHIHAGNLQEVMAAAVAACVAESHMTPAAAASPFADLQRACVRVAEELLLLSSNGGGGGGGGSRGGDAPDAGTEAGHVVALFACRFHVRPLLFRVMRWWRRRLASCVREGRTLPQLATLLADLKGLDAEAQRRTNQPQPQRPPVFGASPPAKRARAEEPADAGEPAGDRSDGVGGGGGRGGGEGDVSVATQLAGFLWGEVVRVTRPDAALLVLQAFPYTDETDCLMPYEVRREMYRKLAALQPAQRLELPASFRAPGTREFQEVKAALLARQSDSEPTKAKSGGLACDSSLLRAALPLIRACEEWQREQEGRHQQEKR